MGKFTFVASSKKRQNTRILGTPPNSYRTAKKVKHAPKSVSLQEVRQTNFLSEFD
jgi:hypothetical protein